MPNYQGPGGVEYNAFKLFGDFFSGTEAVLGPRLEAVIDGIDETTGNNAGYKATFWDDQANTDLKQQREHYEADWLGENGKNFFGPGTSANLDQMLSRSLHQAAYIAYHARPMKPLQIEWTASDGVSSCSTAVCERPDAVVIVVTTPKNTYDATPH